MLATVASMLMKVARLTTTSVTNAVINKRDQCNQVTNALRVELPLLLIGFNQNCGA